jgi:hypothetical protein
MVAAVVARTLALGALLVLLHPGAGTIIRLRDCSHDAPLSRTSARGIAVVEHGAWGLDLFVCLFVFLCGSRDGGG